jgi:hypothetical protein
MADDVAMISDRDLRPIVAELLPDVALAERLVVVGGEFHHVVLVPGTAAVRIARRAGAESELARCAALLDRLVEAGLPFAVPEPLAPVQRINGHAALPLSWLDGKPMRRGVGDPAESLT